MVINSKSFTRSAPIEVVGLAGVEPATYALGMRRSIHVSYSPAFRFYNKFLCIFLCIRAQQTTPKSNKYAQALPA
jgi:hypothetical protein